MSGGPLAQRVLQHAIDLGVRECCVCTGSRNSDLVHGLLQNQDVVRVYPFFEERSAAFFALGRQMATGRPVAVVTTSGTAVAELLPAAIEAYYQARPLVLITADRPTEFRRTGAPQAIEQAGIFGVYAHDAGDVIAATDLVAVTESWSRDRPLHLNVCFGEPRTVPEIALTIRLESDQTLARSATGESDQTLGRSATGESDQTLGRSATGESDQTLARSATGESDQTLGRSATGESDQTLGRSATGKSDQTLGRSVASGPMALADDVAGAVRLTEFLHQPGPLLVMAGCWTCQPEWVAVLEKLQAPILADLTSGLHGIPGLRHLLLRGADQTAAQLRYQRVLRLGGVPSFRAWRDLETQPEISVLSIGERPFTGLARDSTWVSSAGWRPNLKGVVQEKPSHWRTIEDAQVQLLEVLLDRYPACEVACLRRVFAAVPNDASVFLGNSLAIREGILTAPPGTKACFHANRGANGIDGNLSTFLGMCDRLSVEHWGLFGDLTTLYDLSAPAILSTIPEAKVRIVVINNGGGKIFRLLPNWQGLPSTHARVVENHHEYNFSAWAQSWGLGHVCIAGSNESVDTSAWMTQTVVEIRPDSSQSDSFWEAWRAPS